jgi:hypothetical protein
MIKTWFVPTIVVPIGFVLMVLIVAVWRILA